MKKRVIYPTVEKIIEYNFMVLNVIKVKKADRPQVLSHQKIFDIVNECEKLDGDIYDKAVCLLMGIVQKHPFASGNRRTAFIVTKNFVLINNGKFKIVDDPKQAEIMLGIRQDYYTDLEIRIWIKDGKIKKFKRQI